jgi:DNA-binding NtrC family response regulator
MSALADPPVAVLFVDDEPALLRTIARSLTGAPMEVLTAIGAYEALSMMSERRVDVLVSDIDMPEMNGIELVRTARREHPRTLRMLLTGRATLDKAVHAINDGEVVRFFGKPFEAPVFVAEIDALRARIRQNRGDRETESRRARRAELSRWLEARYPGSTRVDRGEGGEITLDLLAVFADLDEGHLPAIARDLLRKEG